MKKKKQVTNEKICNFLEELRDKKSFTRHDFLSTLKIQPSVYEPTKRLIISVIEEYEYLYPEELELLPESRFISLFDVVIQEIIREFKFTTIEVEKLPELLQNFYQNNFIFIDDDFDEDYEMGRKKLKKLEEWLKKLEEQSCTWDDELYDEADEDSDKTDDDETEVEGDDDDEEIEIDFKFIGDWAHGDNFFTIFPDPKK